MKPVKRRLCLSLFVVLLAGCAAMGPKFAGVPRPKESQSSLVIYRPHSWVNQMSYPSVFIDGEKRGVIKDSGYAIFDVAPGDHKIEFYSPLNFNWSGRQTFNYKAEDGRVHFVRFFCDNYRTVGSQTTAKDITITQVSERAALEELTNLSQSE